MARKYDELTKIYDETSRRLTSPSEWRHFLESACRNYRLRFDEQILVFAQRPDATAVLEIERWNKQFGRWVNRGASGIAVFEDAERNNQRLKYYFDISDTHESRLSRPVPIWNMREEYTEDVVDTLESTFGALENRKNLEESILSAANNAVEDNMTYTYDLSLWYRNGGKVTHNYLKHIRKDIRKEIFTYLQSLPLYYDIEVNGMQYKLVHAAPIDKYGEWDHGHYINEKEFAVWHRIEELLELPDDYTLVFGHTPTIYYQNTNPTAIWYGQNRICIDCGAGYSRADTFRTRLACLRLDDYKEFYSTM